MTKLPPSQDIRFLYSGRILKDTDLLSDHLVTPPESQVFTIHMSCTVVSNERNNPHQSQSASGLVSGGWWHETPPMSNSGYSGLNQDNLYNTDVNQVSSMVTI